MWNTKMAQPFSAMNNLRENDGDYVHGNAVFSRGIFILPFHSTFSTSSSSYYFFFTLSFILLVH